MQAKFLEDYLLIDFQGKQPKCGWLLSQKVVSQAQNKVPHGWMQRCLVSSLLTWRRQTADRRAVAKTMGAVRAGGDIVTLGKHVGGLGTARTPSNLLHPPISTL